MEIGSLVHPRRVNLTTRKKIDRVAVFRSLVPDDFWWWPAGEIGLFLGMEDPTRCPFGEEVARVFYGGRVGWVYPELIQSYRDSK